MGNCSCAYQGDKPSRQKTGRKIAEDKVVVMTFAGSDFTNCNQIDPQPPTFSDPNHFIET